MGGERLLVLHGGPGAHHDYLLPQMLRLAARREIVLYDQRGGGRSRTDDRTPVTWRTNVDDLALVVRELGLEPLTIVGYSWGGLLALLYAVESERSGGVMLPPERLVLIDPAPASRRHRERFEAAFAERQNGEPIRRMRDELVESGLREIDPEAYRQRLFELSVAGYFADPTRARDLTPFRVTGRVQQSVWESLGEYDLRPDLARVHAPTLIVHGRQDPIPLESSESTAAALPDARLVVLENSGHVPYVEAPDGLFDRIDSFLNERSTA
jgi:proline iminopeptidase